MLAHAARVAALCGMLAVLAHGAAAQSDAVSADAAVEAVNGLLQNSAPSTGLTCSINITGSFDSGLVNTTGSQNILDAAINCTGGMLTFAGGPALLPYNASFRNAVYYQDYSLPGATMAVRNQAVTFVNSNWVNLTPNGEASIILSRCNATFQTANFTSNKQAIAGAIRANDSSSVAILNSTFVNNTASNAGAVSIYGGSTVFVNGSTFASNSGQQGGGIAFQNGTRSALTIANSVFARNAASTGGGVFAQDCGRAILLNNYIANNQAGGSGGGIFQLNCGGALVLNAVSGNNATAGGAAYINSATGLTLSRNEWAGNTASVGAGAVDLQSVSGASVANDTFARNRGQQGGAYFGTATACAFTSCTFSGNNATLNGGGIFRTQGSGDITLCLFVGNYARQLGGGVYDSQVTGDITGSNFTRNAVGGSGGAQLFRLQSAGSVAGNVGLAGANDFTNQLPNATATVASAG